MSKSIILRAELGLFPGVKGIYGCFLQCHVCMEKLLPLLVNSFFYICYIYIYRLVDCNIYL